MIYFVTTDTDHGAEAVAVIVKANTEREAIKMVSDSNLMFLRDNYLVVHRIEFKEDGFSSLGTIYGPDIGGMI